MATLALSDEIHTVLPMHVAEHMRIPPLFSQLPLPHPEVIPHLHQQRTTIVLATCDSSDCGLRQIEIQRVEVLWSWGLSVPWRRGWGLVERGGGGCKRPSPVLRSRKLMRFVNLCCCHRYSNASYYRILLSRLPEMDLPPPLIPVHKSQNQLRTHNPPPAHTQHSQHQAQANSMLLNKPYSRQIVNAGCWLISKYWARRNSQANVRGVWGCFHS
jgi:hypothetical protein